MYSDKLKKEIQNILDEQKYVINKNINVTVETFKENAKNFSWFGLSYYRKLSEEFLREFKDFVHWHHVTDKQVLSVEFIKEFIDYLNVRWICSHQQLSEDFIIEFMDTNIIDTYSVSCHQKLSEKTLRTFIGKHYPDFNLICKYQQLSEKFILDYLDYLDLNIVLKYQKLSKSFICKLVPNYYLRKLIPISFLKKISEYATKMYNNFRGITIQLKSHHDARTLEQKRNEMKNYAKKYNLKFEKDYLYAYRCHEFNGREQNYRCVVSYEVGKYYKDWRCDLNKYDNSNKHYSFGYRILDSGNTPIKVHVNDWGCAVHDETYCRVWGFTVLDI